MPSPATLALMASWATREPFGKHGFDLADLRAVMATRRPPLDPAVAVHGTRVHGLPATWVLAPGARPERRLLYLHGGGYVSGSGDFYLQLAARYSAATACAVLLLDYRLAPEAPYPAGLEDCIQGCLWVRDHGPIGPAPATATFLAGDSAGGGLTLAALLALRDRGLPLPAAAVALSPFSDLTLTGASLRTEADRDPVMHPNCLPRFVDLYLAGHDARDPLASPSLGDYRGLPPLLVQVGEHEVIRDDAVLAAANARAAGVDATLEVWPGLFHVFPAHEPLLPEGAEAIAHAAALFARAGG